MSINAIASDDKAKKPEKRSNSKADAAYPVSRETRVKVRCDSTNSDNVDTHKLDRLAAVDKHQHVGAISCNHVADCGCPAPPIPNQIACRRAVGSTTSSRSRNVSFGDPIELETDEAVVDDFEPDETASQRGLLANKDEQSRVRINQSRREHRDSEVDGRSLSEVDEECSQSGGTMDGKRRASIEGSAYRSASRNTRDRALRRSSSSTTESNREPSLGGISHRYGVSREQSCAGFSIRDESSWRIALEVSLPFILAGFGMVAAGVVLDIVQHWDFFIEVDQAMIMVPALLGLKGNLEMTLASRMSTLANMGKARESKTWWRIAVSNIVLTQAQALVVGFLAALVAMLLSIIKPGSSGIGNFSLEAMLLLISSAVCTASIASLVLGCIIIALITLSKKYKCNPDIIALPIAASLGDMTTLGLLALIGQSVYSMQPDNFWLLPLLSSITFLIPLWLVLAYRSEHTRQVVTTGWLPIILAMAISSCAGLVLDGVSERFENLAIFQPVVNGIAGNLAGIQASNLSTRLHQLFVEPGRVTSRFAAAARAKAEKNDCGADAADREHRSLSPSGKQDSSPSRHDSGFPNSDAVSAKNASWPCTIPQSKNGLPTLQNATAPEKEKTAQPTPSCQNGANVEVHIGSDEQDDDDARRSLKPPSPRPSIAAVSFQRPRSLSCAWSTLTSTWADHRGLLVHGLCPNPCSTFCGPRMHARTGRVLLYLAIPGHFIFMTLIYFCKYHGQTFYSCLYIALYLFAVFTQILVLLYITHWLVQLLWKRGNDPDNFAIPYLTATGDIIGSLVLAAVFNLVFLISPNDPIAIAHSNDTISASLHMLSTHLNDSLSSSIQPFLPSLQLS